MYIDLFHGNHTVSWTKSIDFSNNEVVIHEILDKYSNV